MGKEGKRGVSADQEEQITFRQGAREPKIGFMDLIGIVVPDFRPLIPDS